MAWYIRRKKKTNECDVACAQPFSPAPDGIGDAIPCVSGDRFDNILGYGFLNTKPLIRSKKFYARKRKIKK